MQLQSQLSVVFSMTVPHSPFCHLNWKCIRNNKPPRLSEWEKPRGDYKIKFSIVCPCVRRRRPSRMLSLGEVQYYVPHQVELWLFEVVRSLSVRRFVGVGVDTSVTVNPFKNACCLATIISFSWTRRTQLSARWIIPILAGTPRLFWTVNVFEASCYKQTHIFRHSNTDHSPSVCSFARPSLSLAVEREWSS